MGGIAAKSLLTGGLDLVRQLRDLKGTSSTGTTSPSSPTSPTSPLSPTGIIGGLTTVAEKLAGATPTSVGSLRRSNSISDFRPDAGGSGSLKRSNSWSGESPSSSREIGDSSRGGGNFVNNVANTTMAIGGKAAKVFGSGSPVDQAVSTGEDFLQGQANSAQITAEAAIRNSTTKAAAAANQSEEQTSSVASIGNKGAANTSKAASGG